MRFIPVRPVMAVVPFISLVVSVRPRTIVLDISAFVFRVTVIFFVFWTAVGFVAVRSVGTRTGFPVIVIGVGGAFVDDRVVRWWCWGGGWSGGMMRAVGSWAIGFRTTRVAASACSSDVMVLACENLVVPAPCCTCYPSVDGFFKDTKTLTNLDLCTSFPTRACPRRLCECSSPIHQWSEQLLDM